MSLQVRNPSTGLLERVAGFNDTDIILNSTSSNPIANKSVYAALAQKIDKTVNDLINYYTKSQTYSQEEVRALIGAINTLTIEVVAQLPTTDISTTTIYFVGPTSGKYDEYVYVNNVWVKIGDTEINLSGYVTSAQLTTALQSYYDKTATDALFNDYYDKDTVDDLLDLKQDVLTFDNTPISGSSNPVTSAGIKAAIDAIPSNPVDATTNGDMHAVTSNAAYDADRAIANVVNQLMNALKWRHITGTPISPRTADVNLYYNANSVAITYGNPAGTYTCNQAYDNGTTVYYYARLASFSNTDVNTAFPGATNVAVGKMITVGTAETNKVDDNNKVGVYLLKASSSTWYLISSGFRSLTSGQKITTTSAISHYSQYYHKTSYYSFPSNA